MMPDRLRLHHWFRLGYAARGLVFMGLGAIAWSSGRGQSTGDVVARLHELPLGGVLLIALVAGLVGLGLFRLAEAWLDLDRRGSDAGGMLQRIGRGLGALGYFAVAGAALALLFSGGQIVPDPVDAARQVRRWNGGGLLLILAGLTTIGAAAGQAAMAWHCRFMDTLRADAPAPLRWLGRLGYAARAVVFFLIGWQLIRAGLAGHRIRDVAGALSAIRDHVAIFRTITGGLFLFGAYSLIEAWYRRMPDDDELRDRAEARLGA